MRTLSLVLLFTLLSVCCFADVVFFSNGNPPIQGKVTETKDKYIVELPDGTKKEFMKIDVEKVLVGKTLKSLYKEKEACLNRKSISDTFELAMWCDKVGLQDEKCVLLLDILRIDPENELVHKYLGHKYINGRWVSPLAEESFGEDIPNSLQPGITSLFKGKYFNVRTDTSEEFARFVLDYLDQFAAAVIAKFDGDTKIKVPRENPEIVIYSQYSFYREHFRVSADKILPRDSGNEYEHGGGGGNGGGGNNGGNGNTEEDDGLEYNIPKSTCFLDPTSFEPIMYRYKPENGQLPLRRNVQKCAGYAIYKNWFKGMKNMYKSPMFLIEGFSQLLAYSKVENNLLIYEDERDVLAPLFPFLGEKFSESDLMKIDPVKYYQEDALKHRALSWAYTRFSLGEDQKNRLCYFSVVSKDESGIMKISEFKKIYKKTDKFFDELFKFIKGL